ncbi:Uncharacterised protein [Bordetella pertussis]|nr:Uncharacterised protein [Bordetella pertussis]
METGHRIERLAGPLTRLSRKLPKLIPRRPGCVFEME